jgi:hypothetical protein
MNNHQQTIDLEMQKIRSSWIAQFLLIKDNILYKVVPKNNVFTLYENNLSGPMKGRTYFHLFLRQLIFLFDKQVKIVCIDKHNKRGGLNSNLSDMQNW